jgi:hypothetical protein
MGVSYRHAKRLYRRYLDAGPAGLIHRSAGRPSNRAMAAVIREQVLELVRETRAAGTNGLRGPTSLAAQLAAEKGITIDHETLRRWMIAAGLWTRVGRRIRGGGDRQVIRIELARVTL